MKPLANALAAKVRGWLEYGWILLATSLRRHVDNQGTLRSAGLTYLTLMALIPGLAVLFAIAGALGVREEMGSRLQWLPEGFVERAQGLDLRAVGAVGLILLIYVVMSLLARIEQAFNVTWQAKRGRNLARRYADYLALLFLLPLLVLLATGLNTVVQIDRFLPDSPLTQFVRRGTKTVPFALGWLAATLLYKIMPNTRVRLWPALLAGGVAGVICWLAQVLFLKFNVGVAQAQTLYGPLAFVPVFLIYLNVTWSVVLWGAELAHVVQNRGVIGLPGDPEPLSPAARRRLALSLLRAAAERFRAGGTLGVAEFASGQGWPRAWVDDVVKQLETARLAHRVRNDAIVPAAPPGAILVGRIFAAIDGDDLDQHKVEPGDEELLRGLRDAIAGFGGVV